MKKEKLEVNLRIGKGVELEWLEAFNSKRGSDNSTIHGLVSTFLTMNPNTKIWIRNSRGKKVLYKGAFSLTKDGIELVAQDDI